MTLVKACSIPAAVPIHEGHPHHLHLSDDGLRLAMATPFGVVLRCLPGIIDEGVPSIEICAGAKSPVTVCALSPDNYTVIGGDDNGNIHVWAKGKSGAREYRCYKLDMEYVKLVDITTSACGRRAAVVGNDLLARKVSAIINIATGASTGQLIKPSRRGHYSCHYRRATPTSVITAGWDGTIQMNTGPAPFRKGFELSDKHSSSCVCVRWSPCWMYFASLGIDGSMYRFDSNGKKIAEWSLPRESEDDECFSFAFSPTGQYIVAIIGSAFCIIESVGGKVLERVFVKRQLQGVAWSRRCFLITCDKQGKILGFPIKGDMPHPSKVKLQEIPEKELRAIEGTDSIQIATKATFNWTGPMGKPVASCMDHVTQTALLGTTTGSILLVQYDACGVRCHSVHTPGDENKAVRALVFDNGVGLIGLYDGTVFLMTYDWNSDAPGDAVGGAARAVGGCEVVFSHCFDSQDTLSGIVGYDHFANCILVSASGLLRCMPLKSIVNKEVKEFKPIWESQLDCNVPSGMISSSRDGTLVAIAMEANSDYCLERVSKWKSTGPGEEDGHWEEATELKSRWIVEIFECDDRNKYEGFRFVQAFEGLNSPICNLKINPAGTHFAATTRRAQLAVVDISTNEVVIGNEWHKHSVSAQDIAWGPDSATFATVSVDAHLFIYDFNDRESVQSIPHEGGLSVAEFLYTNILLTCGEDASVTVWELVQPEEQTTAGML